MDNLKSNGQMIDSILKNLFYGRKVLVFPGIILDHGFLIGGPWTRGEGYGVHGGRKVMYYNFFLRF